MRLLAAEAETPTDVDTAAEKVDPPKNNDDDASATKTESVTDASTKKGEVVIVDCFGGGSAHAGKKGEVVSADCFGNGGGQQQASLQDRFKRFRKERKRERALAEQAHVNAAMSRGAPAEKKESDSVDDTTSAKCAADDSFSPTTKQDTADEIARKTVLRKRFVDTCLSYLGVPYAQKKHTPEEEDYHAPLFLDCCGLVRRALLDLDDDLGFRIGKWNQAYQYETLNGPAIYGKMANESTITCDDGGAVDPEVIVSAQDEKKPPGFCSSISELKSGDLIFVEGSYLDEAKKPQRHCMVHVEVFLGSDYGNGQQTVGSRWGKTDPEEGKVRGVQIHDSYKYVSKLYTIHRFLYVSIDPWLSGRCVSQSYPDAAAARVSSRGGVNYTGGKSIFERDESGSDDEEADGGKVLDKFVPFDFAAGDIREQLADLKPEDAATTRPPIFYVGEGNNHMAVVEVLENRGWKQLPYDANYSCRFDFKWVEQRGKIDYSRHMEGQLVNHIPNNDVITSKAKLLKLLNNSEAYKVLMNDDTNKPAWIHPLSFSSEKGSEKLRAFELAEKNPEGMWLLKPSKGLGGKGIELVRSKDLRERLFPSQNTANYSRWDDDQAINVADGEKAKDETTSTFEIINKKHQPPPAEGWVIQQYIHPPLLLDGRKFDIRAYCLVARTEPALWFFHPGYCKIALEKYYSSGSDNVDLSNLFAHLTNASVQKQHPKYREQRGQHIWSLEKAEEDVAKQGLWTSSSSSLWKPLEEKMKRCLTFLYRESKGQLARRSGYFDLQGIDFMVGQDLSLYLLEVNSNPAIWFDSSDVLRQMVPKLVSNTVDLVVDAQKPISTFDQYASASSGFQLIVDEKTGYVYGEK